MSMLYRSIWFLIGFSIGTIGMTLVLGKSSVEISSDVKEVSVPKAPAYDASQDVLKLGIQEKFFSEPLSQVLPPKKRAHRLKRKKRLKNKNVLKK